jgi:fructose-1,6-bisphosphatase I
MCAAGYTMYVTMKNPARDWLTVRYGSSCNLVLSTGQGVHGFTLDEVRPYLAAVLLTSQSLGEFILTHPSITLPDRGKIYSFNEGNASYFHPPTTAYLDSIKFPKADADGKKKSPYSARYIGSMVADVHRTLLYGGIFGYPGDTKSKNGMFCNT